MTKQQQFWVRQQGELLSLTKERQVNSAATLTLQTQHTILLQRKVRTESMYIHGHTYTTTRPVVKTDSYRQLLPVHAGCLIGDVIIAAYFNPITPTYNPNPTPRWT